MSEFLGDRSDKLLDQRHNLTHFATEHDLSHNHSTDLCPCQFHHAEPSPMRRDFFRYSNRQFMLLICTLSVCFAVNRQNHIDDFIFALKFAPGRMAFWIVLPLVVLLLMARAIRKFQNKSVAR